MLVTDSQIHVWEVDGPDRPWPQPPRNEPQREGGFSAEEALAAMDAAGVDRAVLVPPTWVGENNATALEAAERFPDRLAVMGRFDIDAPDAQEQLAGWLDQPGMLGIRVTFLAKPRIEQLDDGSLEWFWDTCERHGIPLMMLLRGAPEKARPIVERRPGLKLILDHMALDLNVDAAGAWASMDRLVALARFPGVFVKVSSVPNFSAEPYPHRDVHPHLKRLYEAYGPQRLFWGSDVTRLKGTYADCLRMFQEELDILSADDRELVLGKSLADCLDWPE
ncbi:MAG: amidohydrolase family protein [Dehalococcoidia bacterium]|nr:amidohydrolase family protein [Dehalococcoidia bacterium]